MDAAPVPYMERTRAYYTAQGFEAAYVWAHFDDVPFETVWSLVQATAHAMDDR